MEKPKCQCCGAQAMVMRRNVVPDGKTVKPAEVRWYCRKHAPAPEIPASAFKPFESFFKPPAMESR